MVFTVCFAASRLGVDIDVIQELAEQMAPEDGCLSVSTVSTKQPSP
jgi:hypothetical protein